MELDQYTVWRTDGSFTYILIIWKKKKESRRSAKKQSSPAIHYEIAIQGDDQPLKEKRNAKNCSWLELGLDGNSIRLEKHSRITAQKTYSSLALKRVAELKI